MRKNDKDERHKISTSRRVAATKANREKARRRAYEKLSGSGLNESEFEVRPDAKINTSINGGRWVEAWIYVYIGETNEQRTSI